MSSPFVLLEAKTRSDKTVDHAIVLDSQMTTVVLRLLERDGVEYVAIRKADEKAFRRYQRVKKAEHDHGGA